MTKISDSKFFIPTVAIIISILVGAIQLSEYLIGYELNSADVSFYWNLFRKSYFYQGQSLWFDDCGNGLSLLANIHYGLFNIANFAYKILSYETALRFNLLFHYGLFGYGFWLWGRQLSLGHFASVLAGSLFTASGIVLSMQMRGPSMLYALAWLPIACYFAARYLKHQSFIDAIACGVALGSSIMEGDVQAFGYGVLGISATFSALHSTPHESISGFKFKNLTCGSFGKFSLACAFAFLVVSGFQIYHAWGALQLSDRSQGLASDLVLKFSFHPARIIEFVWPFFYGISGMNGFTGSGLTSSLDPTLPSWWYQSIYLGPCTSLLFLWGLFLSFKNKKFRSYGFVVMLLAFWSTGIWNPFVKSLIENFDLLRIVRYPAKTLLPAILFMFPIIGLAIDELKTFIVHKFTKRHATLAMCILSLLTLGPELFQPTPIQYLPPIIHETPEILRKALSKPGQETRVLNDIYMNTAHVTPIHKIIASHSPMYWGTKTFFCPDATINSNTLNFSLNDFTHKSVRDFNLVSHLLIGSEISQPLKHAIDQGLFETEYQSPIDGVTLLKAKDPPIRFGFLSHWHNQSSDPFAQIQTVNFPFILTESGFIVQDKDRILNWQTKTQPTQDCTGSANGIFDIAKNSIEINSFSTCDGIVYANVNFTEGWTIKLDQKPTWGMQLRGKLIGIPVKSGNHKITLKFEPKIFKGFVQISLALQFGVLLLAATAPRRKELSLQSLD